MKQLKPLWMPAAAWLAGCATADVMPLGQDTYQITHHGAAMTANAAAMRADVLKEAQAYCTEQGKVARVIEAEQEGGGYGKLPETDLQFRCTSNARKGR